MQMQRRLAPEVAASGAASVTVERGVKARLMIESPGFEDNDLRLVCVIISVYPQPYLTDHLIIDTRLL